MHKGRIRGMVGHGTRQEESNEVGVMAAQAPQAPVYALKGIATHITTSVQPDTTDTRSTESQCFKRTKSITDPAQSENQKQRIKNKNTNKSKQNKQKIKNHEPAGPECGP